MTDVKYVNERKDLICQVQNILDEKLPPVYSSDDDSDVDHDDWEIYQWQNMNYNNAREEVNAFEIYEQERCCHTSFTESK